MVSPLGARICSIQINSIKGPVEVHEYYPEFSPYTDKRKYSGATVGPVANRIKNASFHFQGTDFDLEINDNKNCLHSGSKGFHLKTWSVIAKTEHSVKFQLKVKHLEDGFPGNRTIICSYNLVDDDIWIQWEANTDQSTHFNLTNHAYFNLGLLDHLDNHFFMIKAKTVLELDDEKIPTGNEIDLDSYFELNTFQRLGNRIFDHHFNLKLADIHTLAAAAYCPETDITLEVYTSQPGIQFYTGNKKYFCFETQHYPDSPNQSNFPSTLITPSEKYSHQCIYRFNY